MPMLTSMAREKQAKHPIRIFSSFSHGLNPAAVSLQIIVMKTGTHPFISKLKLFFKWGISFPENSYTIADKGARRVHYISRETLIKNITARYPQEKKPRVPTASPPSGGLTMTEPAEATFAQEVNHAAQQEKIAKPMRTG